MSEGDDLVEINLNGANSIVSKNSTSTVSTTIPHSQSLAIKAESKFLRSIFGGNSIEFVPNAYRSPTDLSCLRQMYCPDCQQRLHADNISYDRLFSCCLPIFPFKCFFKRAIERRRSGNKVVCKKCDGNLGYWKQK